MKIVRFMKKSQIEDSIFTIPLPLAETYEEVENIKQMYPSPKYDPYFIASGCIQERRDRFDKLWRRYKGLADTNFLKEIQTNFHQRTWEMYLGNVLLEKRLQIQSKNEGPDFVIDNVAYIECVAPTKGDPNNPDSVSKLEYGKLQDVPTDKMILRITQAFNDKVSKYKRWQNKTWFNSKTSYIIAVNTADLEHPEDDSMPNVLKALFGFQYLQINMETGAKNFSHRKIMYKTNNESVDVNYFLNSEFDFVSGVIFSSKNVLNHPEKLGDDCIFVNNPFAKYPVDDSFIKLFKNWLAKIEKEYIVLEKNIV
jgi:hypothetical protein